MEGGVLWSIVSIVLITMKWRKDNGTEYLLSFLNIYPNKHEDNEIEENNNEMEYLFYFNEMEYLFSFCQYLTYRITDNNGMEERCSLIYCSDNNETEYLFCYNEMEYLYSFCQY